MIPCTILQKCEDNQLLASAQLSQSRMLSNGRTLHDVALNVAGET